MIAVPTTKTIMQLRGTSADSTNSSSSATTWRSLTSYWLSSLLELSDASHLQQQLVLLRNACYSNSGFTSQTRMDYCLSTLTAYSLFTGSESSPIISWQCLQQSFRWFCNREATSFHMSPQSLFHMSVSGCISLSNISCCYCNSQCYLFLVSL